VLACVKRAAHGQRRGDMRVLGVFENWAEKFVYKKTNCHFSGDTHTHTHRERERERERETSWAIGTRAPPPDPRLKPGPVFVASGVVIKGMLIQTDSTSSWVMGQLLRSPFVV